MTFDVYLLIFCARTMKSRCRFELGLFIKYFMLKCNKELFSLLNIFLCGLEFSSHQTDIQMGDLNHWHVFSYFGCVYLLSDNARPFGRFTSLYNQLDVKYVHMYFTLLAPPEILALLQKYKHKTVLYKIEFTLPYLQLIKKLS